MIIAKSLHENGVSNITKCKLRLSEEAARIRIELSAAKSYVPIVERTDYIKIFIMKLKRKILKFLFGFPIINISTLIGKNRASRHYVFDLEFLPIVKEQARKFGVVLLWYGSADLKEGEGAVCLALGHENDLTGFATYFQHSGLPKLSRVETHAPEVITPHANNL